MLLAKLFYGYFYSQDGSFYRARDKNKKGFRQVLRFCSYCNLESRDMNTLQSLRHTQTKKVKTWICVVVILSDLYDQILEDV